MQLLFVFLTLLLLAVALFALQNPDVVTVRFWPWQFHASVALVALGGAAAGALAGWLLALGGRLLRWQKSRAMSRPETPLPARTEPTVGSPPGT